MRTLLLTTFGVLAVCAWLSVTEVLAAESGKGRNNPGGGGRAADDHPGRGPSAGERRQSPSDRGPMASDRLYPGRQPYVANRPITAQPDFVRNVNVGRHDVYLAGNNYRPSYRAYPWYNGYWYGNRGWVDQSGPGANIGWGSGGVVTRGDSWLGRRWAGRAGLYEDSPLGWGVGGWGLGSLYYRSGYMPYTNPYYLAPSTGRVFYNYAQPIPVALDGDNSASAEARQDFDAALGQFKAGEYPAALALVDKAIQGQPSDAVMHEFRALVLFAMKDYSQAAATIHAVLAVGPGWNWATLSSLYPSVEVYTPQLRNLESYVGKNPDAANAQFLLGYHYMTADHPKEAADKFREVIRLTPGDRVAADLYRMVGGHNGQAVAADRTPSLAPTQPVQAPLAPAQPVPSQPVPSQTTTDKKPVDAEALVGTWHASRGDGSKFDLNLIQDKTFSWKFAQQQRGEDFSGTYMTEGALLILQRTNGGAMVGQIAMDGADRFSFKLLGAPADDAGLAFHR